MNLDVDIDTVLGLYGDNKSGRIPAMEVGFQDASVYLYLLAKFKKDDEYRYIARVENEANTLLVSVKIPDITTELSIDWSELRSVLGNLEGADWIGDWYELIEPEPGILRVSIGEAGIGYSQLYVSELPAFYMGDEQPSRSSRDIESDDSWGDREKQFEEVLEGSIEKSEKTRKKKRKRIRERGQHKRSSNQPDHLRDDGSYKRNKKGLVHHYVDMYRVIVGTDPPNLYKNGKPSSNAYKIFQIADDYGVDIAFEYITWIRKQWEQLKQTKSISSPPNPSVVSGLRDDVCPYLKAGKDPIAEMESASHGGKHSMQESEYDANQDRERDEELVGDDFTDDLPEGWG